MKELSYYEQVKNYFLTRERLSLFERTPMKEEFGDKNKFLVTPNKKYKGYFVHYYLHHTIPDNSMMNRMFGLFPKEEDSWDVELSLGKKYAEFIEKKLYGQFHQFTPESVKIALAKYPAITNIILSHYKTFLYKGFEMCFCVNALKIYLNKIGPEIPRQLEEKAVDALISFAEKFVFEVNNFSFDPSPLKLRPRQPESDMPKWVKSCMYVGARACVKLIGAEIDFVIQDSSDSGNLDFDLYDIDTDFSDSSPLNYQDGINIESPIGDDCYNVMFCGKDDLPPNANSDGYIPKGDVCLNSTVSDIPKHFKLFVKDGHKFALFNGAYYRIDGSGTVTIGGIKYDKI